MKIYVNESKKIKGSPTLVKKELKFEGKIEDAIADLRQKQTPYFEVVEKGAKTKTVYTKETWQKNYIKKEVKA